jgi:hypothetical protein
MSDRLTKDVLEEEAKKGVEKYLMNHVETAVIRSPKRVHIGMYMTADGPYEVYITAEKQDGRSRKSN